MKLITECNRRASNFRTCEANAKRDVLAEKYKKRIGWTTGRQVVADVGQRYAERVQKEASEQRLREANQRQREAEAAHQKKLILAKQRAAQEKLDNERNARIADERRHKEEEGEARKQAKIKRRDEDRRLKEQRHRQNLAQKEAAGRKRIEAERKRREEARLDEVTRKQQEREETRRLAEEHRREEEQQHIRDARKRKQDEADRCEKSIQDLHSETQKNVAAVANTGSRLLNLQEAHSQIAKKFEDLVDEFEKLKPQNNLLQPAIEDAKGKSKFHKQRATECYDRFNEKRKEHAAIAAAQRVFAQTLATAQEMLTMAKVNQITEVELRTFLDANFTKENKKNIIFTAFVSKVDTHFREQRLAGHLRAGGARANFLRTQELLQEQGRRDADYARKVADEQKRRQGEIAKEERLTQAFLQKEAREKEERERITVQQKRERDQQGDERGRNQPRSSSRGARSRLSRHRSNGRLRAPRTPQPAIQSPSRRSSRPRKNQRPSSRPAANQRPVSPALRGKAGAQSGKKKPLTQAERISAFKKARGKPRRVGRMRKGRVKRPVKYRKYKGKN